MDRIGTRWSLRPAGSRPPAWFLLPALSVVFVAVVLVGLLGFASVEAAHASGLRFSGWGAMTGLSSSPDQFVIGGQVDLGQLALNFHLMPNADIAFGDDLTVFSIGPNLLYFLPIGEPGRFYFGGGISLVYAHNDGKGAKQWGGGSSTDIAALAEIGFSLARSPGDSAFFVDGKFGITEHYADAKLTAGYHFSVID